MTTEISAIEFTASAARRVHTLRQIEKNNALMLRLMVNGGGCSGFSYKFDFDDSQAADDLVIETDGVKLLIDPASQPFLEGATVDYVEELIGASFRVSNPNATASCGCGTSFSVM